MSKIARKSGHRRLLPLIFILRSLNMIKEALSELIGNKCSRPDIYRIHHININLIFLGVEVNMENDSQVLITVEELCEILMIGKNAAYQLLSSGKIKCFRIGRIWKIPRESVDEYIRRQTAWS